MSRHPNTLIVAATLLGLHAATLPGLNAQRLGTPPGGSDSARASLEQEARGQRTAEYTRETVARRNEIYGLDADGLAKLQASDRLLYLTYAEFIGRILDIGEPLQGVDKIVKIDVRRRGMEASELLARIFREEPYPGVRGYILRWLEWEFSFPATPILEEARSLYWREGEKWNAGMQGDFARTLAGRGLATDMAILEDLQKRWDVASFKGEVAKLQKRILLGEERGGASGELPLIPESTSPTVEPTPLPPFGEIALPSTPSKKQASAPAIVAAQPLPVQSSSFASLFLSLGVGAVLCALLLWWCFRRT